MKLMLDDTRNPPEGWVIVRTVKDAINALKTGCVTELSLDHDLGSPYSTGYDVLNYLEQMVGQGATNVPKIHVHSMNAGARPKMEAAVRRINQFVTDNNLQGKEQ